MFPGIHDLIEALDGLFVELKHQFKDTIKDYRKEIHSFFQGLFPKHEVHHVPAHKMNLWHNPLDFFKQQKPAEHKTEEHHEHMKIDPLGDLFKQLFPVPEPHHQQKRSDPLMDMMNGLFKPPMHHEQQQHASPWGMPMNNGFGQMNMHHQQPQFFGFENFKLF
jgi:hypothetical protein